MNIACLKLIAIADRSLSLRSMEVFAARNLLKLDLGRRRKASPNTSRNSNLQSFLIRYDWHDFFPFRLLFDLEIWHWLRASWSTFGNRRLRMSDGVANNTANERDRILGCYFKDGQTREDCLRRDLDRRVPLPLSQKQRSAPD